MKPREFFKMQSLSKEEEAALIAQHGAEIQLLLPILGPMFGLAVLLFGVWDYLIDPAHAPTALAVRVLFVLAGSIAYRQSKLQWTPVQRCGYIYGTHASAIIICEFLLEQGFIFGLAGIVACLFAVSVVTLQVRTFLLILVIPTCLFVTLSALNMTLFSFINSLMLYIFSVGLACTLMLVIRFFRRKAFLLEKELLHISRHDSLTGACNRRYITELGEREVALAKRHRRALAVAMIDIDHFKKINDTYGHPVGDQVIKRLVNTCTENLRAIDHFGRIGGEEFICVLPEADRAEAVACAERLRRSAEAIELSIPEGTIRFTISIGIALLDQSSGNWTTLLKDADKALYRAKHGGRNCVAFAAE